MGEENLLSSLCSHGSILFCERFACYLYRKNCIQVLSFSREFPKYLTQEVPILSASVRVQCGLVHGRLVPTEGEYNPPDQPYPLLQTTPIQ